MAVLPAVTLSEEEMWQAVLAADATYDHLFFYGVASTGIFCFPSCTCRKPRREHVRFFSTREAALAAGFRPCKRCRPDLPAGRWSAGADLVTAVRRRVDEQLAWVSVRGLAAELGLSQGALQRAWRELTGYPLHRYIRQKRLQRAAELLRDTDLPVLEVAAAVGFRTASAFYAAFRRVMGAPPAGYRRLVREGHASGEPH